MFEAQRPETGYDHTYDLKTKIHQLINRNHSNL